MTNDARALPRPSFAGSRRLRIPFFAAALIGSALTVAGVHAFGFERRALWPVVQTCVAAYKISGVPFPCMEADLSRGEKNGFVILRPPIGLPDTILVPTRRLTGVEDPFLQEPGGPNYFADAWAARGVLDRDGVAPASSRIGLVVNPLALRSQDQLHIHIGCFAPDTRAEIAAFAAAAPIGEWRRFGRGMPSFWGLRTGRADLEGIDPFQLAAKRFGSDVRRTSSMMIAVAESGGEFVVLVNTPYGDRHWMPASSDDMLDPLCVEQPDLSPN